MKPRKSSDASGGWRRRSLFAAVAVVLLCAATYLRADAYDTLRLDWVKRLTGGTNYNLSDPNILQAVNAITSSANSYLASLNTAPGRTYLWSDLASTTDSGQISTAYTRLESMALAYATYGSSLQGNTTLLTNIIDALDWMNVNRYSATATEYDNWWDWQIGSPLALTDIAALLYPQLSSTKLNNYMAAVNKFTPNPQQGTGLGGGGSPATGANLAWQSQVVAVRACLVKSSSQLSSASSALNNLFPYVTNGDGFYADGSFVQHSTIAYNGGYGNQLIQTLTPLVGWLKNSTWAVTSPQQTNLVQWVYSAFEPLVYKGAMMDMVRGRYISRSGSTDHNTGQDVLQTVLQISQFAPTNDAARMRAMIKYWAQTDTTENSIAKAPLPLMTDLENLLSDSTVLPRGELLGHFTFAGMDRVVHLRPGWGFGLAMFSSRISNYESFNGENVHGWFTGSGMTYLYNGDLLQYGYNFWPTVDPYRLPGITVDYAQNQANGAGQSFESTNAWVGGVTLNGYGSAGMKLQSWANSLVATKSWFMFDNEIVCLGAGITSANNSDIETVVDNRRLTTSGTNEFIVNGAAQPAGVGWSSNLTNVSWAHLVGNTADAQLGYYFPQPVSLNGLRAARTGSWADITASSNSTVLTQNYLALWLDQGTNPVNADYAYVLLPNFSTAAVSNYAASPPITILTNTALVQAVRSDAAGVTGAHFWSDGSNRVDFISSNRKAAVIACEVSNVLQLAVADPTQTNTSSITLTLNRYAVGLISADPAITVVSLTPQIVLSVGVGGARGRSFQAQFIVGKPSTASGGPWSAPTTWAGGVVPASTDNAVIATTGSGMVYLDGSNTVQSLYLNAGSQFSLSANATNETLTIHGDLVNNGAITRFGSTPALANTIIFSGAPSHWTGSGNLLNSKSSLLVNAGATLDVSGLTTGLSFFNGTLAVTVNGTLIAGSQVLAGYGGANNTFTLGPAGTLVTANLNGITNGTLGTVSNFKNVNLSTGANYVFNGATNQSTLGLPVMVNSLTVDNTNGVVLLSQQTTVAATATLAAEAVLSLPAGTTSSANALVVGGQQQTAGIWGNTGSGAANIDPVHFAGTGCLFVQTGPADAAHSTISPGTVTITANGWSTQTITVQARDASDHALTVAGLAVVISKTAGTGTIDSTTDNGDGTYTAIVTSPTLVGTGTFAATLSGAPVGTAVAASNAVVTYDATYLLLDFGPTQVTANNATLSPTQIGAVTNSGTYWNSPLTTNTAQLAYASGQTATGVSLTIGRSSIAIPNVIDFTLSPRNSALGGFGNTGIYAGTSPAKDAIFGISGGGDSGSTAIAAGVRLDGLPAGDYTIYFSARNTSTFDSSGATPQRFYARAGVSATTYAFSFSDANASESNSVPMNTTSYVLGDNCNFVTVTVGAGQSLYMAAQGTSTVDQRGFLNTIELIGAAGTNAKTLLPSARVSCSVSSGGITLSWPIEYRGWILQSQTNLLNQGLGTNWMDMAGTAALTTTNINPANPCVFFRLRSP